MNKPSTHESYGLIQFAKYTHPPKTLFGSNISHTNSVRMTLSHAKIERGLNSDWYIDTDRIIQIELSGSQFADLITNLNQGSGTPCTIIWESGKGFLQPPPAEDKIALHKKEFSEHQTEIKQSIKSAIDNITEIFKKKSITKSDKEYILSELERLNMEITKNSEYQLQMFDLEMAKTVQEAKNEIEFFAQKKLAEIETKTSASNLDTKTILPISDKSEDQNND